MAVLVEGAKGALNNKGGRGQRNREEIGAGATWTWTFLFTRLFTASPLQSCSRQNRHATQATIPQKSSLCSQGTIEPPTTATSLQRPLFGGQDIHWLLLKTLYNRNFLLSPRRSLKRGLTVFFFLVVVMPCTLPCVFCSCLLENGSGTVFLGVAGICQEWDRSE